MWDGTASISPPTGEASLKTPVITDAVILAGGLGTRLRPLTLATPKVLLPVHGRPFLETQFFRLRQAGLRRITLSLGHQADQVEAALPSLKKFGLKVGVVREKKPLGTGGAIRHAWLDRRKPCLVLNGDVLSDAAILPFVRFHASSGALASIWVVRVPDASSYGLVKLGPDGGIRSFAEKPALSRGKKSGLINAGLYALQPEALSFIPRTGPASAERGLFPAMLAAPARVMGFQDPVPPYWRDIGTLEAYFRANMDAASDKVKLRGFWT